MDFLNTENNHFQKVYLLAELVHFFLTTRLLYVFTFSLGGSTEPPLDPPQSAQCAAAFTRGRIAFLLTWSAAVQISWNKSIFLHKRGLVWETITVLGLQYGERVKTLHWEVFESLLRHTENVHFLARDQVFPLIAV